MAAGNKLTGEYWSSSELGTSAWQVDLDTPNYNAKPKNNTYKVRAVRPSEAGRAGDTQPGWCGLYLPAPPGSAAGCHRDAFLPITRIKKIKL